MQQRISRIGLGAAVTLVLTTVIVALASISGTQIFESDFIKALKQKFHSFYTHAKQDRVYLQTDKAFYKPGETLWFTAYVRDEATLKPSSNSDIIHVELITPKGTTEKHYKIVAKGGTAQGDFDLNGHPAGIYKIKAYTEWQKNDENALFFEKEITVQNVVMPRLKMKLDFEKKAYGKGDEVIAKLELNTNDNKPLANTQVKFKAQLDGKELSTNTASTGADGKVNLKFALPKDLSTVDGIVNAMIDYEGNTEAVSRSIPIVLNKITLEFFPEGGDMVSNANCRVAFRASNEFSKPADVEGVIVDSKGVFVAKFISYHFGMGAVDFIPRENETYKAHITKPEGILDEYNLPEVAQAGYVMKVANQTSEVIDLSVHSFQEEELSLIAETRGKVDYTGSFRAARGNNSISINTQNFPIGISQITLFDSRGIARCERLVFVNKNKQLKISVGTDKSQYQPRERVAMNIKVTDEKGLPMPGNFSLAVVDDNLLSFADDRQGNILSKMLLEPDLKEKVEEPNFYFDTKEPKADKALDLLMMTSGWRKYTWKKIIDEDYPAINYAAEKAQLSGTVYDGYTSTPVVGAVLKLKGTGKTATTDKDGKFTLARFDISKSNQLEITAPGHTNSAQLIYNYGENYNCYIYPIQAQRRYYMNEEMVPMAATRGGVGGGAMGKAEKRMPVANANAMANLKVEEFAEMDVAKIAADVANPDDVVVNPNVVATPERIENVKVADNRAEGFLAFDKKILQQGGQVSYYRAKEFPVKKYSPGDSTRNDFGSTVYWNGNVSTDQFGRARVEFTTNDLISSFKATLEGFTDDGSVGRAEYNFSTNLPFSMDAKIPVELVSGDKMMIPVFLKNNTNSAIIGRLFITSPKQLEVQTSSATLELSPNAVKVFYLNGAATNQIGDGNIEVKFASEKYHDAINRSIRVVAKGFPANISLSGQDLNKEFVIKPENVVPGSMKISFSAYPNIMSELMSGVASILREPYGCFEQTSSSNYPNIMALQYLKSMNINDPALEAKATKLLDQGYKKLTAFETKENGYEWFGAAPAHEALTAYGLMEFEDMKKVYPAVDNTMIDRTVKLLLNRRDGEGGFKKNPRALDSFGGADEDVTNAYIIYALSEAGYNKDIQKELDAVYKSARKSGDPYIMALCTNALFNVGDKTRGEEMLAHLLNARGEAGFWTGKKHSITRSTGESLKVETTSLTLLAMMKSQNPDGAAIISAVKYLVSARSGYGGFGSTQATILALKSLTRYAEYSRKTDEAGSVAIYVNGLPAGTKDFAKGQRDNINIDGLEKYIGDGKQKIEVRFKDCKQALPYAMNISYSTVLPESAKQCAVDISTRLSASEAKVGETVRLSATVKNKTNEGQPMTMAIVGIPAGLSAQPWQLKEMQEKGGIDFYEINGNNIAFYYRSLAPNAIKQINLDLKAEIPGEYDAPASSAYLYYTNELKSWVGLNKITVKAI